LYETVFDVITILRRITLGVEKTLISTPGIDDFLSHLYDGVDQMKLLVFTYRQNVDRVAVVLAAQTNADECRKQVNTQVSC
jgi:hypothetical protein